MSLYEPGITHKKQLMRGISVAGAMVLVINSVIGAGCFSSPAVIDRDVNGNVIPAPSGPAGARMCDQAVVGAGRYPGAGPGPCGSYELPETDRATCSTGMSGANAITKAYMYILEDYTPTSPRLGNSMRFGLQRDHALVFRLTTGPASAFPNTLALGLNQILGFSYEEYTNEGPMSARFVTLSEKKCDFDYSKTLVSGALNGCYKNMGLGDGLQAMLTPTGNDPTVVFPFCQLKPNTTYYLNIRYEDARTVAGRGIISCPAGADPRNTCGQTLGLN